MAGRFDVHGAAAAAVAAKLRARRYQVTSADRGGIGDLHVRCPGSGTVFSVAVRGLRKRNNWVLKPAAAGDDLYYVLTVLDDGRFFVLSRREAEEERDRTLARLNRSKDYQFHGFTFGAGLPYENRWDRLPAA